MTVFFFFFLLLKAQCVVSDRHSISPPPYSVNVASPTVRKGLIRNQKEQLDGKVICIFGQDLGEGRLVRDPPTHWPD